MGAFACKARVCKTLNSKRTGLTSSFQLFVKDSAKTPVASFHRRQLGIIGDAGPASLEIFPAGKDMIDLIVVTGVYLEKLNDGGWLCVSVLLVVGILPVQKRGYQKAAYIYIDCEAVEVLEVTLRLAEGVDSARGEHQRVRKILQRTKCC